MSDETLNKSMESILSPVGTIKTDRDETELVPGAALCLSGGGYRAMMFHVGTLWRLNELAYLPKLERISSVSGGSITSAVLGLNWSRLDFDVQGVARRFGELLVEPVLRLSGKTVDRGSILIGTFGPSSIGEKVAEAYRKYLFGDTTLQDLPDSPRFVINATNVQSGALWRFMKPYMRDYRVGEVRAPRVELAVAVAASAAFPPVLSPVELELQESDYTENTGMDLQFEPYTTDVVLTDGGVYDNLGLETAWKKYKTILVSDAGGKMEAEAEPKGDWVRHSRRILDLIDNQVRSLRKRQVIDSFKMKVREGAYWGIRTNIADYGLADAIPCDFVKTTALANIATRLERLEPIVARRLINWGYAVCDAAMRRHVDTGLPVPSNFPFPDAGIG